MIIPPGYGSAAFVFTGPVGTEPFVTTIGLDLRDYGGDYDMAAEKAFIDYQNTLLHITTAAITLDHVSLTVGIDGAGVGSVTSIAPPAQGQRSGDYQPMSTAAIARKSTNLLGRRGQGRMFLPGTVKDEQVDINGILTNAFIGDLQQRCFEFIDALNSSASSHPAAPPVLLHSAGGPAVPTPINALIVSPKIGLLRKRIR